MRARATTASERPGGHNAPWRIIVEGAVTWARAHRCMRFADQLHAQTLELERSKYTADAIQAFYRSSSSGSCIIIISDALLQRVRALAVPVSDLACPAGQLITSITYANLGTSSGTCRRVPTTLPTRALIFEPRVSYRRSTP